MYIKLKFTSQLDISLEYLLQLALFTCINYYNDVRQEQLREVTSLNGYSNIGLGLHNIQENLYDFPFRGTIMK